MKRHATQIVLWTAFLLFPMSADAQITDDMGSLGNWSSSVASGCVISTRLDPDRR